MVTTNSTNTPQTKQEYQKEWRANNKKRYADAKKRSQDAVRMEALIHYSCTDPPRCALCKVIGGLELRLSPAGPGQSPYVLRKQGWPKGIRVLCFSCVRQERGRRLLAREVPAWLDPETGKHTNWHRSEVGCSNCGLVIERKRCHMHGDIHFCCMECSGEWKSKNLSGSNSPLWKGGKVTVQCAECATPVQRRLSEIAKYENTFCGPKCRGVWASKYLHGDKIYNYAGGYDPNYGPTWRLAKRAARKRDNYTCQRCGITQAELKRSLDVHHKIRFKKFGLERHEEANALSNLISYCPRCHKIVEEQVLKIEQKVTKEKPR